MSPAGAPSRREFMSVAGALVSASQPTPPLPKVKFQGLEITRLIVGSNPLYGYSHFNSILDRMMREWMTQDRRIALLHRAEECGINTWQVHYNDPTIEDLKRYRAEGGRMHWLLLADFELMTNWKLLPEVARLNPIGIAHHGNRTDQRFRSGQRSVVRDFIKAVHDAGVPAGVSTHNPAVIEYIEEHGWDVDYYMTCMYRITRTPEEARKEFGEAPVGEMYMERDPERMCEVVRKTRKACFAFKVLGAGRHINRPEQLERAFRFVLTHIKPQDAIIVGMFPRYKDEVRENVELVSRILSSTAT